MFFRPPSPLQGPNDIMTSQDNKKKSTRRVIVHFLPRECCYCGCRIARDELNRKNFMSMDRASYNVAIIIQQDATKYNLFKSVTCSTCFRWYFTHHQELTTVSTVSGINETVTATATFPSCHVHDR